MHRKDAGRKTSRNTTPTGHEKPPLPQHNYPVGQFWRGLWVRLVNQVSAITRRNEFLDPQGHAYLDSSFHRDTTWVLRGFLVIGLFLRTFPTLWGLEFSRYSGIVHESTASAYANVDDAWDGVAASFAIIADILQGTTNGNVVARFLDVFVYNRIYPLLGIVFGAGFAFMWMQIRYIAASPRRMLIRAVALIVCIGFPLAFFVPGNLMFGYTTVVVLIFVIPLWMMPMRLQRLSIIMVGIPLAVIGTMYGVNQIATGGWAMIGFGLALLRVPWLLERRPLISGLALVALIPLSIASLYWQISTNYNVGLGATATGPGRVSSFVDRTQRHLGAVPNYPQFGAGAGTVGISDPATLTLTDVLTDLTTPGSLTTKIFSAPSIAGTVMCLTYICIVLLLMSTAFRRLLLHVFGMFGRAPLTNYVVAMLIARALAMRIMPGNNRFIDVLGIHDSSSGTTFHSTRAWATAMVLIAVVAAFMWLFTYLWFRSTNYEFGPLEVMVQVALWWGMKRLPDSDHLTSDEVRETALRHLTDIQQARAGHYAGSRSLRMPSNGRGAGVTGSARGAGAARAGRGAAARDVRLFGSMRGISAFSRRFRRLTPGNRKLPWDVLSEEMAVTRIDQTHPDDSDAIRLGLYGEEGVMRGEGLDDTPTPDLSDPTGHSGRDGTDRDGEPE